MKKMLSPILRKTPMLNSTMKPIFPIPRLRVAKVRQGSGKGRCRQKQAPRMTRKKYFLKSQFLHVIFSHQYCPRDGPGPDPPLAPGLDLQSSDVVLDKEGQGAVVKVLAAAGHAGNNIACIKK